MANIYLLRHGNVDGPAALYGHTDVSVSCAVNSEIAAALAEQKLDIDGVYSSPLIRCMHLATTIADNKSIELTVLEDLTEMNFGRYDGVAFDELYQNKTVWPQLELFWKNPVQHPLPHAELLTGFSYRITRAWQMLVDEINGQGDKNILVVCHGGVIRMILAHLLNVDYRNPNWYTQLSIAHGSLTTIESHLGEFTVKGIAKPILTSDNHSNSSDFSVQNIVNHYQCMEAL